MEPSHVGALTPASEAAQWIRNRWSTVPRAGIILGTGLGNLAQHIDAQAVFPYDEIPHFPRTTAIGHRGHLICGTLASVPVVTMEGRLHAYEGYSLAETTLPVRVLRQLGVRLLIVSNASGGMNPNFGPGEIMVVDDHINLMSGNPLVGSHDPALARYPAMSAPYDPQLIGAALRIAR
ncbi:MAG: purine-nucleoside phosphorylase, partial [Pirellulales bacterium]